MTDAFTQTVEELAIKKGAKGITADGNINAGELAAIKKKIGNSLTISDVGAIDGMDGKTLHMLEHKLDKGITLNVEKLVFEFTEKKDKPHVQHHNTNKSPEDAANDAKKQKLLKALHDAGFHGSLLTAIKKASHSIGDFVAYEDNDKNNKLSRGDLFVVTDHGLDALNAKLKAKGKQTLEF